LIKQTKKIDLSIEGHALLCDFKNELFQQRVKQGSFRNLDFEDAIIIAIKSYQKQRGE
jgi:hypothetical protein